MTGQGKSAIDTLLAESFKELALKHPIEKITIKEITDKAGVIRPTFYNHFQDKYELLEWIIDTQLIAPAEPLIQNGMVNEALVLLFSNIEKEKEFYQKASRLEGQNSFESIAQSCIMKVFLRVFERSAATKKPKYVWLTPERIADCMYVWLYQVVFRHNLMTRRFRHILYRYNVPLKIHNHVLLLQAGLLP